MKSPKFKRNYQKMQHIEVYDHRLPFVLLQPDYCAIRDIPEAIYRVSEISDTHNFCHALLQLQNSPVIALDYETTGLDVYKSDFKAIGIGLASYFSRVYIVNDDDTKWLELHAELLHLNTFIAHNVMFDGAVFFKYAGSHPNWLACTYGMYKQLANEGWYGQKWGLKDAQIDLLQWESSNEVELDDWLVKAGHHRKSGQKLVADKSCIHLAPTELIAKYCMLDCEATYLLYTRHLLPTIQKYPQLWEFHENAFIRKLVPKLIEQYLRGIRVLPELLEEHRVNLQKQMQQASHDFRAHPDVAEHVRDYENSLVEKFLATEPTKFKQKSKAPKEPNRFKKNGEPSNGWLQWKQRHEEWRQLKPAISKNWLKWDSKRIAIPENSDYQVNLGSADQIRHILYKCSVVPHRSGTSHLMNERAEITQQGTIHLTRPDGMEVELDLTESGKLPLGEIAYKQMGEIGQLLLDYNELKTELGYIESYLGMLDTSDWGATVLHPNFRAPGPITGRLSSQNPNLQQLKKKREVLQCFVPRDGYVLIDCDLSSIEGVTMAYLSGDSALGKLYGPNAPAVQDLHLFNGAAIPGLREPILAAGYDPNRPTEASITRAKKEAKSARDAAKTAGYALVYGASASRIWRTLNLDGIPTTLESAKEIYDGYWALYGGVRQYSRDLQEEWRVNAGYVLNPLGHPICIAEDLIRDAVNRITQNTAHLIHTLWMDIFTDILDDEGIKWHPFIIDWHDQSIIEVRPEDADRALKIMQVDSFKILNERLGWNVTIKGDGQIVSDLAEAKL